MLDKAANLCIGTNWPLFFSVSELSRILPLFCQRPGKLVEDIARLPDYFLNYTNILDIFSLRSACQIPAKIDQFLPLPAKLKSD